MNCGLEFGTECSVIFTVGMLREALQNYPDDTMLSVCGEPGVLRFEEDVSFVILDTLGSQYEDDAMWMNDPGTYVPDYLAF